MLFNHRAHARYLTVLFAAAATLVQGATTQSVPKKKTTSKVLKKASYTVRSAPVKVVTTTRKTTRKASAVARGPWRVPNYAPSAEGDFFEGDDIVARNAAVGALGRLNGSVVVADADSGRILTIVNQKLAYKSGFQPCSTIKVPVALAALSETVVDRLTKIRIYGNTKVAISFDLNETAHECTAAVLWM